MLVLLLLAVAAVAPLSGCGGDDSPQTKESFILEADGVCEEYLGEFAEAGADDPGTAREVANANTVLADLYERFMEDITDVRLPAAGPARTEAQAYIDSVERSAPLLDRLRATADAFVDAAEGTDTRALTVAGNELRTALDRFRANRAESDRLAVDYGLNLCGNLD